MTETVVLAMVAAFLIGSLVHFVVRFVRPAMAGRKRLDWATGIFNEAFAAAQERGAQVVDLDAIDARLEADKDLLHLWREFRHTLHAEQGEATDDHAQLVTSRFRQTVPSELYFSSTALIDVPLRTAYFRHLPGILTGLGIIGTFGGLIVGLTQFDVAGTPNQVNSSVEALVSAVRDAFWVSAAAILSSILVTVVEKAAVAGLSRQVQELQHAIDRMFDAGAGEDYLSAISDQSSASATYLGQLRDGLINDLREILEEVTAQQVAATQAAAQAIGTSVTDTLQEPMTTMAAAMERSMDDQQQAVHQLMEESLSAFATRLEEVVGEKLSGAAGQVETAAMSLRQALTDAPAEIKTAVAEVQSVLSKIASSAGPIAAQAERMSAAAGKLAQTVEEAAETMDYALGRLKSLGEQMATSLESTRLVAESLDHASSRASEASSALAAMTTGFDAASAKLESVVDALAGIAESSGRDADAQDELVRAVERAAEQLTSAQANVEEFLSGVSAALIETHETFGREINKTLDQSHESFHHNLASATEALAGTVSNFGEFLETDFRESVDELHQEFARLNPSTSGTAEQ